MSQRIKQTIGELRKHYSCNLSRRKTKCRQNSVLLQIARLWKTSRYQLVRCHTSQPCSCVCSVLSEDVTLYKSQLETDTSVTAKSMLSSLVSLNTSLTQLFQETLYELKRIKDFKSYLPSQLSNDTKLKLRLLYT